MSRHSTASSNTPIIVLGIIGAVGLLAFIAAFLVYSDLRNQKEKEIDRLLRENKEHVDAIIRSENRIFAAERTAEAAPEAAEAIRRSERDSIAHHEECRRLLMSRLRELEQQWP
jgi:hypothetical protein